MPDIYHGFKTGKHSAFILTHCAICKHLKLKGIHTLSESKWKQVNQAFNIFYNGFGNSEANMCPHCGTWFIATCSYSMRQVYENICEDNF